MKQPKQQINLPTETQIAWFAGILDGEGCIFTSTRTRNGNPQSYYNVSLTICMTHLETLERIKSIWNLGNVRLLKTKISNKQRWNWCVSARECLQILTITYPYLVTKRNDALIAMTLQQRLSDRRNHWGCRVPNMEIQRRNLLSNLCKKVKQTVVTTQNVQDEIDKILADESPLQLGVDKLK